MTKLVRLVNKEAQDWCEKNGIADAILSGVNISRKANPEHAGVALRRWGNAPQIALAILAYGFDIHEQNGWRVFKIDDIAVEKGEFHLARSILLSVENDLRELGKNSMSALLN